MPRLPALTGCTVALVAAGMAAAGCRPSTPPMPAPQAAVRLAPATTRYTLVEHRHMEQQYQGQAIVTDAVTRTVLSVVIDTTAAGFVMNAVVDSLAVTGDAGLPAAVVGAMPGARFRAQLGPDGGVRTVDRPPDGNGLVEYVALRLHELVPRLPMGGAGPGATWRDSMVVNGQTAGIPITIDARERHASAADWVEHAGRPVLSIRSEGEYALSGEGERTGQWVSVAGTGASDVRRLVGRDGVVAFGTRADTLRATIELAGSGVRIPILQVRTDTLRRVD